MPPNRETHTIFVGRKAPVARLSSLFSENLQEGKGPRIISIYGKSGVGKSFLVERALRKESRALKPQLVLKVRRTPVTSLPQVLYQVVRGANVVPKNFKRTRSLLKGVQTLDRRFLHHIKKENPRLRRAIEDLGVVGLKWALKKYHLTPDVLGVDIEEQDIRALVNFAQEQTSNWVDRFFKTSKYWAGVDLETFAGESLWEDINELLKPNESLRRRRAFPKLRKPVRKRALVFIIDDYEGLSSLLEGSLLRLASKLADDSNFNSLLVFVGRNELSWTNEWRHFASFKEESIRLDVFTEEEVEEYLDLKGVDKENFQDIMEKSHRLPLLLEILSDAHLQGRKTNWIEDYFRRITYHMNPKEKQWLEMLSFVDGRIDEDIISEIVGAEYAKDVFEWFKQEGTAHIGTEKGWEIDPIVRSLVRERVWQDSRLRAEEYRREAMEAQKRVEAKLHRRRLS